MEFEKGIPVEYFVKFVADNAQVLSCVALVALASLSTGLGIGYLRLNRRVNAVLERCTEISTDDSHCSNARFEARQVIYRLSPRSALRQFKEDRRTADKILQRLRRR